MIAVALLLASAQRASAVPREEVLDNAMLYGIHTWTMSSSNETASCDSAYTSDYSPGTYTGLPYDWGGYMSTAEYDSEIASGYGAGSHSSDGILSCTAGVDCSGFISEVWETGHYTTSTIPDIATSEEWSVIERGDVVDNTGSHVVLFTHISQDGWPVFWEASGSADKVHLNSSSGWSYLNGYVPYRYNSIEDGTSTGTTTNPKPITSFPYTDYGWTAGAASDSFDVYNCSSADESGPEVIYHATIPGPGTVDAVVSDGTDVDIDVYILTAADDNTCLARNDTEATAHVTGTDFWLVADTYVGSQEYSGPYVLTVDFTPDASTDTGGDTATTDTGRPADSGVVDSPADSGAFAGPDVPGTEVRMDAAGGCGCASAGDVDAGALAVLGLFALAARSRRASAGSRHR